MALQDDPEAVKRIKKARIGVAMERLLDAIDAKGLPGQKTGPQSVALMLHSRYQRRKKPEEKEW